MIKKYTYDDVVKASLDYFDGDEFAATAFAGKYSLKDEEGNYYELTPDDSHKREARELARAEAKFPNPMSEEEIYSLLKDHKYVVLQGSPKAAIGNPFQVMSLGNCFVKGTKVFTNAGPKNIEDVQIGDIVPTHMGRYRQVKQLHKNPLNGREVFSLKCFRTPEVKVTGNHKFWSISNEQLTWGLRPSWNEVSYLRKGDWIAIPHKNEELAWSTLIDVYDDVLDGQCFTSKNDTIDYECYVDENNIQLKSVWSRLGKNNKKVILRKDHNTINRFWNIDENFAFFLGLWYGDGCIFSTDKNTDRIKGITFTFGSHEKDLIDFVSSYGKELFGLEPDINWHNANVDGSVQVVFYSAAIGIAFQKLFGRGCRGKKLWDSIFNWPTNMVEKLIAGLVSSDGTVTASGDVRVVLANKELVSQFYSLSRINGMPLGFSETEETARLDFPKNSSIVDSVSKHYNDDRIKIASEKEESVFGTKVIDGVTFVRIDEKSLVSLDDEFVYTLGVEEDHSYCVEGLICQNCFVIQPPYDSYGGILKSDQELAQLMKRRAGVGLDISNIRPKGMVTKNAAKTTDGIAVFMERFSNTCREVAQCIAENERVLTNNGLKPIQDVCPKEDKVWTRKGWVTVDGILRNTKKVFEMKTSDGFSIKASADHVFLTECDGELIEKKLGDFEIGEDVVLIPGSEVTFDNIKLLPLNYISKARNNGQMNEDVKIPSELTPKLAYILGVMFGDGCVEFNKFNEPRAISIACGHSHPKVESNLISLIEEVFGLTPSVRLGNGAVNRVNISSKLICHWLQSNDLLKQKSSKISVPSKILQSNTSVQMSFMAGFFDADGFNGKSKKGYVFSTCSLSFAKDIQTMLMAAGILSKIHVEDRSEKGWLNLYSTVVVGTYSQELLIDYLNKGSFNAVKIYDKFISKRDSCLTPFKYKTFKLSRNNYSFVPDDSHYLSTSCFNRLKKQGVIDNNILVKSSISSINELDEVGTYDLQLAEEHLFWCEGFYVHNSGRRGAEMQSISIHHPEVLTFIKIKRDPTKVTGANISVRLTNEFMEAVKNDKDYEQRWPVDSQNPEISQMVSAREVWKEIVHSAWLRAEPGLLFWDTVIEQSPADVYANLDPAFKTTSTNPCFHGQERFLTDSGYVKFETAANLGYSKQNIHTDNRISYHDNGNVESPENWKIDLSKDYTTVIREASAPFITQEYADLLEIEFSNGQSIKCTKDHHFATKDGMIEAQHLTPDHEILIALPEPKFSIVNKDPETIMEKLSFLAGLVAGDGTFCKKVHIDLWGDDRCRIKEKVLSIIDDLKENIEIKHRLSNGWQKREMSAYYVAESKEFNKTRISSTWLKHVFDEFLSFNKNTKLQVPEIIINNAREPMALYYLSGLFYADGTITKNTKTGLTVRLPQSDKGLLKEVQLLLHSNGIFSSIYLRRDEKITRFGNKEYNCKTQYELITRHRGWKRFINNIGFFGHPQKEGILDKFSYDDLKSHPTVRITSVSEIEGDTVYCLKEDVSRSLIVNTVSARRCGEIPMGVDSCRLTVINLFNFVQNPFTDDAFFDYNKFAEVTQKAQRIMDDIVEIELESIDKIIAKVNSDPEPEEVKAIELNLWKKFRNNAANGRRTGLGITALGDALAALGLRYGSKESIEVTEEIYKTLAINSYKSSCIMAGERGAFPLFSHELEKDHPFIQRVISADSELSTLYAKYGRRNIANTTTAPVGTISTQTQTSSGIEPVYLLKYDRFKKVNPGDPDVKIDRVDAVGDSWQKFTVYHHNFKKWMEVTGKIEVEESPYYKATSNDIDWIASVDIQAAAQRWVCHAISKTANLPSDASEELVGVIYMRAWERGCKGFTVYRDGCRDGVLVSSDNEKKEEANRTAPDRPTTLPSETHKLKIDTGEGLKNAYVTVSFFPNTKNPYEVFINTPIGQSLKDLQILELSARMTSLALRHGVPAKFIVDQLSKIDGQYMFSIPTNLAKSLSAYVDHSDDQLEDSELEMPEDEEDPEIKTIEPVKKQKKRGDKCPKCGAYSYVRTENCGICYECAYSGCS